MTGSACTKTKNSHVVAKKNSFVSSTFNSLPIVLKFFVTHNISETNRSYSKIYKTVPLAIITPTAL